MQEPLSSGKQARPLLEELRDQRQARPRLELPSLVKDEETSSSCSTSSEARETLRLGRKAQLMGCPSMESRGEAEKGAEEQQEDLEEKYI